MSIHHTYCRSLVVAVAAVVLWPTVATAQTALPVGKTLAGQVSNSAPTIYRFNAPAAGVLTVAVHADSDVTLTVTDQDGQELPDGSSDRDLYGAGGNEQVSVTLPEGGEYRVAIKLLSGNASKFELGAGWIAMPAFARATDPDRRPSLARAVDIGRSHEDALDGAAGDNWDWFVLTAKTSGTLTVILRSVNDDSPDLALELYTAENLTEPSVRSDDDLQGNNTNESATVDVKAGQKIFVKVAGLSTSASGRYRLASSIIQ
jgi:hypothetical protein